MIQHTPSQRKQGLFYLVFVTFFLIIQNGILFAKTLPIMDVTFEILDDNQNIIKEFAIKAEKAETPMQQAQGLMYRKSLARNRGMIFIFDKPDYYGMWMKNTLIPLDIIYVDCDKRVVGYVSRKPLGTQSSFSPEKICYIIEVNAGLSKKIGLKRGDRVRFTHTTQNK